MQHNLVIMSVSPAAGGRGCFAKLTHAGQYESAAAAQLARSAGTVPEASLDLFAIIAQPDADLEVFFAVVPGHDPMWWWAEARTAFASYLQRCIKRGETVSFHTLAVASAAPAVAA